MFRAQLCSYPAQLRASLDLVHLEQRTPVDMRCRTLEARSSAAHQGYCKSLRSGHETPAHFRRVGHPTLVACPYLESETECRYDFPGRRDVVGCRVSQNN